MPWNPLCEIILYDIIVQEHSAESIEQHGLNRNREACVQGVGAGSAVTTPGGSVPLNHGTAELGACGP